MSLHPGIKFAFKRLNNHFGIALSSDSFYHGDSYWYDTEFDNTLYPQNGFSLYIIFKTDYHRLRFQHRFTRLKEEFILEKPANFDLIFKRSSEDNWLLQLKYRCLENKNNELFAYWEDLIIKLSQK